MAEVRVGKSESLDAALKRFKRSCAKDGVIAEVRKREHYEKPSVKRKKKSEAQVLISRQESFTVSCSFAVSARQRKFVCPDRCGK